MTLLHDIDGLLRGLMPRLTAMALAGFAAPGAVTWKRPGQPVTEIDRAIEAEARRAIRGRFPDHGINGEEEGYTPGSEGTVWHLDPIDGTSNFSRGIPFFSVSIGVERGGRFVVGHVSDPVRGESFRAVAGEGAWLGERRLVLGGGPGLGHAHVAVESTAGGRFLAEPGLLREITRLTGKTRKLGSLALELAYVAAGRLDLVAAGKGTPQAIWDVAAGVALVEEAGGVVVDLAGTPITPRTTHFVAGPAALVEEFRRRFG
jgi:myo-inositol-1(or 4)-monophosphatase